MTTTYEVPLSPQPQKMSISLGGVVYDILLKWNVPANCWMLDISDSNSNPIVTSIPLVTGADLLAQYGYLNFGGQLIATTDNDMAVVPTLTNLGDTSHLYFVTMP